MNNEKEKHISTTLNVTNPRCAELIRIMFEKWYFKRKEKHISTTLNVTNPRCAELIRIMFDKKVN